MNINILSLGLLGALENARKENVEIIGEYILNNNILLNIPPDNKDSYSAYLEKKAKKIANTQSLNIIFNAATNFNQINLAKLFTQKYLILEKAITNEMDEKIILQDGSHKEWANLKDDGSLEIMKIKGGPVSNQEIKVNEYALNPILFNLKKFNVKLLDSFLSDTHQIHQSVVEHGLIMNMFLNNSEAVLYLFANKKCADVIKNSNEIKTFINSNKDFVEKKQIARSALLMINLQDELPDNNKQSLKFKL